MRLNRLNLLNAYSAGAIPWTDFWIRKGIFYEMWNLLSKNSEGNAVGLIRSDILSISGTVGSENYQVPDVAGYRTADTNYFWFTLVPVRRSVTTDELRGYDIPRTLVRYLSEDPFSLEVIGLLDPAANLSALNDGELKKLYNDFKLNPFWAGDWVDAGETKENRSFEQAIWTP